MGIFYNYSCLLCALHTVVYLVDTEPLIGHVLPIIIAIFVSHQCLCLYEKHAIAALKIKNRSNGWLQHDSSFDLKQLFTN